MIQPTDPCDRPGLDGDNAGQHGVWARATSRRQVLSPPTIPTSNAPKPHSVTCAWPQTCDPADVSIWDLKDVHLIPLHPSAVPLASAAQEPADYADFADTLWARTGYPLRSARDRSWRNANARARPVSGITTPAHRPSTSGSSQASGAHSHRRGQARHSALASSSGAVVQGSGSRVQAPCQNPDSTVAVMCLRSSRKHRSISIDAPQAISTQTAAMPQLRIPHVTPVHASRCDTRGVCHPETATA